MTAYFDLLVRGVGLASQAGAIGGVFFIVLVLRPAASAELGPILFRSRSLVMASAISLIVAQCLALAIMLESLANEGGWPVREFVGTTYFAASTVRIAACVGLVMGCRIIGRGRERIGAWIALTCSVALAAGSAGMSHAVGRLGRRAVLLGLDTLHQLAASVWVGGLVHLTAAAFRRGEKAWPSRVLRPSSAEPRPSIRHPRGCPGRAAAPVHQLEREAAAHVWGVPLIIGSSAEYGLNVVTRVIEAKTHGGPFFPRSTIMAVAFNGLSTITGFGSLLVAHHRGIWSLGLLLTCGSLTSLVAALVVLPVLIRRFGVPEENQ